MNVRVYEAGSRLCIRCDLHVAPSFTTCKGLTENPELTQLLNLPKFALKK